MQDKITIANAPDCLNTNDKAMWTLGYQAAIEARSQCLLQIQEPPTKTEALAHYSQQAILAMDEAAPAAVAVPDEREAFQDGAWYWVEKEGWFGKPPTIAPALYKAECDAWYSFAFSGISTRNLKVLERCVMQARAALAATPEAALLATGGQAQAVPDGWREQFETKVYADLAAADNQDVPLEEYPARILKVLDSIVGPRHPAVVQWRNDAIKTCIAIAYKYCRDPDSHKYLKQDLEALLTAEPAPQAQADARDALTPAARDVLAERARQISAEGWTPERDDAYNRGVLAEAGGIYALHAYDPRRAKEVPEGWPWVDAWWKPSESPRRNLEKAGALILAEIERFDRAIAAAKGE